MINWNFISIISIFLLISTFSFATDIDEVRINYTKCIEDKGLCKSMIDKLENSKYKSATHLAYLGGLRSIWANHASNPLSKLKTFKQGREDIEDAIKKEPQNPEIRFIRLSIQKNAPSFLGYKSNIKEDKEFIRNNRKLLASEAVLKNVNNLLED